jgi:chromosome segregation ATPase
MKASFYKHVYWFTALLLMALSFVQCSKSVEGQTERYDALRQTIQGYEATYPNFKPALDEVIAAGDAAFEQSKAIKDEKQKIAAIDKALQALSPQWVTQLGELAKLQANVNNQLSQLSAIRAKREHTQMATTLNYEASSVLQQVQGQLGRQASSAAEAAPTVAAAHGLLTQMNGKLKSFVDEVNRQEKAAADSAKGVASAEEAAAEAAAVKMIVCKHCGGQNPDTLKTCKGCGAAVPHNH